MGAVCDHADPSWRGTALGTYRFWRDIGYALGTISAAELKDATDYPTAIGIFCVFIAFAIFCMVFLYEEKLASIHDSLKVESDSDSEMVVKKGAVVPEVTDSDVSLEITDSGSD